MTKTILFAPGFPESRKDRDYDGLLNKLQEIGYETRFIDIDWRDTTQEEWADQLMKVYNEYEPENVILAGFSFGAMVALMVAARKSPYQLWLFSLSPLTSDHQDYWTPEDWMVIGECRREISQKSSLNDLLEKVKSPVIAFIGDEEPKRFPNIEKVFEQVVSASPRNSGHKISGVGHTVDHPKYVSEILERVSE